MCRSDVLSHFCLFGRCSLEMIVIADIFRMFVYQLLKWTSGSSNSEINEQQPDEEIDERLVAEFSSACAYLPTVISKGLVSHEDKLYFYARYKLVTSGKAGRFLS